MKSRILFSLILVFAVLFYLFVGYSSNVTEPSAEGSMFQPPPSQSGWGDKFYTGAMCTEYDYQNSYKNLDSLGLTLWQQYVGGEYNSSDKRWYPKLFWQYPGIPNDDLRVPVGSYSQGVNTAIDAIYGSTHRKLIMSRPKISWLCYGQRSDYKCNKDNIDPSLWFYSFQTHTTDPDEKDDQYGNGVYVRHCRTQNSTNGGNWVDGPGIVVSRLRANTEQCHRDTVTTKYENQWEGDSFCNWLIKPKIRIDSMFAHNYPESPVCSLKVIGQNGQTVLKETIIKAKYFLVDGTPTPQYYNGRYIEEFNYGSDTVNLTIHGDWCTADSNGWNFHARGNYGTSEERKYTNYADIQVYWYGNCDMWIDYIRVDNDVASDLLSTDQNNYVHNLYKGWIDSEVTQIGLPGGAMESKILKYYIEYCEFNNLPCMHYVDSLLKQYSYGKLDLMQDLTSNIAGHVPWDDRTSILNADFLYHNYIQKVGFTQVFEESYPLNACY